MSIVLDASAAIAAILPNQATVKSVEFFEQRPAEFVAPMIFSFEVRNALVLAERRGIADPRLVDEMSVELLDAVSLQSWTSQPSDMSRLMTLARAQNLSLFDAAYLDLAMRESAALASRDTSLIAAAGRLGVAVHDLR